MIFPPPAPGSTPATSLHLLAPLFLALAVGCDPCSGLVELPGALAASQSTSLEAQPTRATAQLAVQLSSLSTLARGSRSDDTGTRGIRRATQVSGADGTTQTLVVTGSPRARGVAPSDRCPSCVRLSGGIDVQVSLGPERPTAQQLSPVGLLLGAWSTEAKITVGPRGPGLEIRAVSTDDSPPTLSWVREQLSGINQQVADTARGLGVVVATAEARRGASGLTLGHLAPWQGPDGPEAISADGVRIQDGFLEATLRLRQAPTTPTTKHRGPYPRASGGRDLAVTYSPQLLAWLGRRVNHQATNTESHLLNLETTVRGLTLRARSKSSSRCHWQTFEGHAPVEVHRDQRPRIVRTPTRARSLETSGWPGQELSWNDPLPKARSLIDFIDRTLARPAVLGPEGQRPQPAAARSQRSGVTVESQLVTARGGTRVRPRTPEGPTISRIRPRSDPRRAPPPGAHSTPSP